MNVIYKCIAGFLVLCFVAVSFAGAIEVNAVGESDETLSIFELTVTEQTVEQIDAAHRAWFLEYYTFERPYQLRWDDLNDGIIYAADADGIGHYYGTYGECIVWMHCGKVDLSVDFKLAGASFHHWLNGTFFVLYHDKLFTLQEAFERRLVDAETVQQIAQRHAQYMEQWEQQYYCRYERNLSVLELPLTKAPLEEIRMAYFNWYEKTYGYRIPEGTPGHEWVWDDITGGKIINSARRYYGTFDDCVVWFVSGNADVVFYLEVAGSSFSYPQSASVYVYRNGEHLQLQQAYELGYISAEDIAIAAQRHADREKGVGRSSWNMSLFEIAPTDEEKLQFDAAHREWYQEKYGAVRPYGLTWNAIREGIVYAGGYDGSIRYYGTIGGYTLWAQTNTPNGTTELTLGETKFKFEQPSTIYAYLVYDWSFSQKHDVGKLFTLQEVYTAGRLDSITIQQLAEKHAQYEAQWKQRHYLAYERNAPVQELPFQQMQKELISSIYEKQFYMGNEEPITWAQIEEGRIVSDGARFYGGYGDALVWYTCDVTNGADRRTLNGITITDQNPFEIYVCIDRVRIVTLEQALQMRCLSYEDMTVIARRHAQYDACLRTN